MSTFIKSIVLLTSVAALSACSTINPYTVQLIGVQSLISCARLLDKKSAAINTSNAMPNHCMA